MCGYGALTCQISPSTHGSMSSEGTTAGPRGFGLRVAVARTRKVLAWTLRRS